MQRILVVRNDKIGDFMLAWPALAMLKASMSCEISVLVPTYTQALAKLCPSIDQVLIDPGMEAKAEAQQALLAHVKEQQFDAVICLFSNFRNAKLMWQAKIPQRWAPATKLAQFFYNHKVTQRRSQSAKPEYEYNLDLVRAFLTHNNIATQEPSPPYLSFTNKELADFRHTQAMQLKIAAELPWVLVHAGSGGSANNLSVSQYAALIVGLWQAYPQAQVVLTAGPGEEDLAEQVVAQLGEIDPNQHRVAIASGLALPDFCRLLACGNVFVAGSTGPLHIAAALDVPTVGFFPLRRSATPLRWRPLNSEGRHLPFHPPANAEVEDMSQVDIAEVVAEVIPWAREYLS